MIPALWILGALLLALVGSILALARVDRDAPDEDLGRGLVKLALAGLALLTAAAWMADLLLYLCVHP